MAKKKHKTEEQPNINLFKEDEDFQNLVDDLLGEEFQDADADGEEFEKVSEAEPEPEGGEEPEEEVREEPAVAEKQPVVSGEDVEAAGRMRPEEAELWKAYVGLKESARDLAFKRGMKMPRFAGKGKMLLPNYKPSVGRVFADDSLKAWDLAIEAFPNLPESLNPASSDDAILNYAEKCEDTALTMLLVSYVETIIEIEGNEITYGERLARHRRKMLEKAIFEEHARRAEQKKRYAEAIRKKRFPVDAERLVGNFFKTSSKDPDGAFSALTENPALFSPIIVDKIAPRFFGMVKPKPEDGIKENKRLGKFLKGLKA